MKHRKRTERMILNFLLTIAMVVSSFTGIMPGTGMTVHADDVILISSAEELKKIGHDEAYPLNGKYKLTKGIDLNGSEENQWTPIGDSDSRSSYFTGTFDGNGHTISGLYINQTSDTSNSDVGLFGYVWRGKINNLAVTGSITVAEGSCIGGIAGVLDDGSFISYCTSAVTINAGNCSYVGGVVGQLEGGVRECRNTAAIIGRVFVGGIAGTMSYYNNLNSSIHDCYNTGTVTALYQYAGGIAGASKCYKTNYADIYNCYNIGAVSGNGLVGAVLGSIEREGSANAENIIHDNYYLTGTAEHGVGNIPQNAETQPLPSDNGAEPKSEADLQTGTAFANWSTDDVWDFNKGSYPKLKNAPNITTPHTHNFSYSAEGAKLTAACSFEGCGLSVSLTLSANSASTYNGSAQGARLDESDKTAWTGKELIVPVIEYTGRGVTSYDKSTTAPTDAGDYTASITAGTNTTATIDFAIGKAAAQTINVAASQHVSAALFSKSVAGKMPEDAGTLTYTAGNASMTGSVTVTDFAVSENGVVTATLSGGTVGDTITLSVTVHSTNYEDSTVNVNITLMTKEEAGVSINGAPESVTYGDADLTLTGAVTDAGSGTGVWTWESSEPSVAVIGEHTGTITIKKAGTTKITAAYQSDTTFGTANFDLTVNPKTLGITWSNTSFTYNGAPHVPTATLSGVINGDVCTVSVSGAQTNAGTGYTATATLSGDDAGNYTLPDAQKTCSFVISKADPTAVAPTGLTATYGQTLADVTLTNPDSNTDGTWTWVDSSVSVGNLGNNSFAANFTPTDRANYNNKTNVNVTITVEKADPAVTAPTAIANLKYTCSAQELITAGSTDDGTMYYALVTNDTSAPADDLYTTSVPKAMNVGNYYVWYKVKGDGNHKDTAADKVSVTISPVGYMTVSTNTIEVQKGTNVQAAVNLKSYGLTGITGFSYEPTSGPVTINNNVFDAEKGILSFKVTSENGGNATITLTGSSANVTELTVEIPIEVKGKTAEVKLEDPAPGSSVTSAVQGVEAEGLSDYAQGQEENTKVVLDVKPVSEPTNNDDKQKIETCVNTIFQSVSADKIKKEYLDIKITKQVVGSSSVSIIDDVEQPLRLAIKYDLFGKYNPMVIREHEHTVKAFTKLASKPSDDDPGAWTDATFYIDESKEIIYIYTRYFSTYSIAYATVNSHTVSFDAKGGNSVSPVVVKDGGKLDTIPASSRSGYNFDGWYTKETGGTKLTTDTEFHADAQYYAHWIKIPDPAPVPEPITYYTVTFDMNGHGSPFSSKLVVSGEKLNKPADPVEEGWIFDGWFTDTALTNAYDFNTAVTADITLYAKWTEEAKPVVSLNSITITTPPTKTEYVEGEQFDPTGMVVSANYTDNSSKEVTNYSYTPSGNLAVSDNEITISYTEGDITRTATQAISVSANITPPGPGPEPDPEPEPVVEDKETWNLFENDDIHTYIVKGVSANAILSNSNTKSAAYYDAALSGNTISVSLKIGADRKKAADKANTVLSFALENGSSVEYTIPANYAKPALKLAQKTAGIREGAEETTIENTIFIKMYGSEYTPMDLTDVEVSFDGTEVSTGENGKISFTVTAAKNGNISVKKSGWESAIELGFSVKTVKKDVLTVDTDGAKIIKLNSNASKQSFTFPVYLNGAAAADVSIEDKKKSGVANFADGILTIAYPEAGVKAGTYTITLKSGDAKCSIKVKVSDKDLAKTITLKVKSRYDVTSGSPMVLKPVFNDLSGKVTDVSVDKEGFTAEVDENGYIIVNYSGTGLDAKNLSIGSLSFTLGIDGIENDVTVTVNQLKAKASKPTIKAAAVTVPKDASGDVLAVANIVCSYKGDDGKYHSVTPESVKIDKVKDVEAAVSEEDPAILNITKLDKKSGTVKLTLTFKGGVTKKLTIKVKKGK